MTICSLQFSGISRVAPAAVLLLCALLSACGMHSYHVVKRGDTLYSIGWWYGIDHQRLAQWNHLPPPYVISVGQKIYLSDRRDFPGDPFSGHQRDSWKKSVSDQIRTEEKVVTPPAESKSPAVTTNTGVRKTATATPTVAKTTIRWHWPAQGRLIQKFSAGKKGNQGIKIAGAAGDMIKAAADGRIVYTGDALLGYGNLIIIKHDEEYLSAYGHVGKALVKEGDTVRAGQRIAEMGSSGTNRIMLHFEIRKGGDPVDPLPFLPEGDSSRG